MKPLHFVGSAQKDLRSFPEDARQEAGYAFYLAQTGGKGINAVPMVGFGGAGVLEVVIDHDGDTYRAVYSVKLKGAVYVLHAFQKKSKKGIKTPQTELNIIAARLKVAKEHHEKTYGGTEEKHGKA